MYGMPQTRAVAIHAVRSLLSRSAIVSRLLNAYLEQCLTVTRIIFTLYEDFKCSCLQGSE